MSIEHKLEITLTPDAAARIIAEHLNKGLSNDFSVSPEQVKFNLSTVPTGDGEGYKGEKQLINITAGSSKIVFNRVSAKAQKHNQG